MLFIIGVRTIIIVFITVRFAEFGLFFSDGFDAFGDLIVQGGDLLNQLVQESEKLRLERWRQLGAHEHLREAYDEEAPFVLGIELLANVQHLLNQLGCHTRSFHVVQGQCRVVIHGRHEYAQHVLFEIDGHRIVRHALLGELEQFVDEGVERVRARQRLEEKLASDGTLAVRDDTLGLDGLLDDLCIDTDGTLALSEIFLAIQHEVVDSIQQVTHLALGFGYDLWEVVEHLPHEWHHCLTPLDQALDQKENIVLKADLSWLLNVDEDALELLLGLVLTIHHVSVVFNADAQNGAAFVQNDA